MAEWPSD